MYVLVYRHYEESEVVGVAATIAQAEAAVNHDVARGWVEYDGSAQGLVRSAKSARFFGYYRVYKAAVLTGEQIDLDTAAEAA